MPGDESIEGLGSRRDVVHVVLERPIGTYSLQPEEAFALSRIVGDPPLEEALLAIGLPGPRPRELLRSLREKGLVRIGEPAPPAREDDESGVELDPDERAAIREMEALLPGAKHWELLGIGRIASAVEVKAAYLDLSRQFHPDRYFGRELGKYRKSIEAIFRRLKEAEATLGDPEKRAAYLAANPEVRTAAQQEQDVLTARRRAERNERLRRSAPLVRSAHGAARLASEARRLADDGRFAEASATFAAAAKYGRRDALLEEAEGAARRARRERAARAMAAGAAARRSNDLDEARARFLEAAEAEDPPLAARALGSYLDCGGDAEAVRRRAAELVKAAPESADAHAIQGRILLAAGLDKPGRAAVERALGLDPAHPLATSLRRRPRWPF
ncbi:MAG TPA: J domain-containing protein [Vulgatibacter sp.]